MKFDPVSVFKDFAALPLMLWAVLCGRWKMPWATLFWGILCLVYLVSPIDLLPDVMPLLGITDDSAFILLVLALMHKDLEAFRSSRTSDKEKNKPADVMEAEVRWHEKDKK